MKTIIAGSRTILDFNLLEQIIKDSEFNITEVVCGKAKGVDKLGEQWAEKYGIPIAPFPAQWYDKSGKYDNRAGFKRNIKMVEYADALIALWDGESKGTKHMIDIAHNKRLQVYYYIPKPTSIKPSKIKKGIINNANESKN